VSCEGVSGWTQDQNAPDAANDVHVYFNGPALAGTGVSLRAAERRDDLCGAIMSCNHSFNLPLPRSLMDGQPHAVHAYGIDTEGGTNAELGGSPRTVTCTKAPPEGVLRHVINPESFAAWHFDFFKDVQPIGDGVLDARTIAQPWPTQPELLQLTGHPEVYFVDGTKLRHVPNPEIAAEWRLDLGTVRQVTSLDAYNLGHPMGRPWLVRGSGPAVYVIDVPAPPTVAPPAPPARAPVAATENVSEEAAAMENVLGGCSAAGGELAALALLFFTRSRGRRRGTR
jgi:hypothetical protein